MRWIGERLDRLPTEKRAYALRELPAQLFAAGETDRLCSLLLDFEWLDAKLRATDIRSLLWDFGATRSADYPKGLALVFAALRLSMNVLADDPQQLASQLIGRICAAARELDGPDRDAVRDLIAQARNYARSAWLCPLSQSLTSIGSGLLYKLETGHKVTDIALVSTPNGVMLVSGGKGVLHVWNLRSAELVRRVWSR